ncbi:MAG: dicarboxylate/amino acid:cation symporter [Pirellulales bacterium]
MNRHNLLTLLILAGLVLGAVVGQLLYDPQFRVSMPDSQHAWAGALGLFDFLGNVIFMGLLKMLIVPLIITSVIVGVTSVGDVRQLGSIGLRTLIYYFATMAIAATIGIVLVTVVRPGDRIGQQMGQHAVRDFQQQTDEEGEQALLERQREGVMGIVRNLVTQIIPTNLFAAAAKGQPLPLIFFCILFGSVLTTVDARGQVVIDFFHVCFQVMMKLTEAILWLAPVGVFALLAWTVARIGLGVFTESIVWYILVVLAGLAIHGFAVLPLTLAIFGRTHPFRFMGQMRTALLTAFGTDSSSATLPVTMECATKVGGVSEKAAGFVLPLGSTINMDGTALYEAVAVVFLAQAYHVQLSATELVLVVVTATLAAVGAAGIPSAGLVTMVIVIGAVNKSLGGDGEAIPMASIGLILGVDRILDMCRTTVNVWGDAVGARIISRYEPDP